MKYIVKRIMEPDYGCEERPDDYVAKDKVILRNYMKKISMKATGFILT